MRTFTIAALALAASLSLAGVARAEEDVSQENDESARVAAESWQEAEQPHQTAPYALGYRAPASTRAQRIEHIFPQPGYAPDQPRYETPDQRFLEQGDRGLGTN